ncbi:MAG: hypothetical protein IPM10_12765 [Chitinophagaceae bacterium]|nr:hypothetical protein [Chitinophagaceae bacterium]
MKAKGILILFAKFFSIVIFTLVATFIMAKLFPPPKGTGFDGLDYVVKPIYMSLFSGFIYLVFSLTKTKHEGRYFLLALFVNFMYVVLLFLNVF